MSEFTGEEQDSQELFSLSDRFYVRKDGKDEFVHKTWEQLSNEGRLRFVGNCIELVDIPIEDLMIAVSTQIPYKGSGDAIFTGDLVVLSSDLEDEDKSPTLDDLYIVHFLEEFGCCGVIRFIEEDREQGQEDPQVFFRDIHPDTLLKVGSIYES